MQSTVPVPAFRDKLLFPQVGTNPAWCAEAFCLPLWRWTQFGKNVRSDLLTKGTIRLWDAQILIRHDCIRERPKPLNAVTMQSGLLKGKRCLLAIVGFDCLKSPCITDLSHGSRIDASPQQWTERTISGQQQRRDSGSKRRALQIFAAFAPRHSALGGRGRLASTQMHAGIVFLFILSLPCRHVLFFFSLPVFPLLFVSRCLWFVSVWTFCQSVLFVASVER